jgi:predicted DNA-binding transcriptional regulator YafY
MRASRLLSTLLVLQAKGRVSARRLAEEMGVSVRTVLRDIDELSSAGVPVRAARGVDGGFELMEGWRTRLTGLTPGEAHALFLAGVPDAAAQLGLADDADSARMKLVAALPADWQADARRVTSCFHLDAVGWMKRSERPEFLPVVSEAVWNEQPLRIRYESWTRVSDRRIEPLGLVLKAGEWYVVAMSKGSPRTFRVTSIRKAEPAPGKVTRPRGFELAQFWAQSLERFEAGLYRGTATLRATPAGLKALRNLGAAVAEAVDRVKARPGWTRVTIPIESVEYAAMELLRVGAQCEVLQPAELRQRMSDVAASLARLYRQPH